MAQEKLKGEKVVRKRHRGNEDYLLTGKLFCGYCLAPMVGMSGRGRHGGEYFYYACQTRRTKKTCSKENVRKDDIELEVVKAVQTSILDDDTVLWIADTVMEASRRFKEQSMISQYESRMKDVKKQIANIVHAIEMGVVGEEVKDRMAELQDEKKKLQGLIDIEKIATKDYDRVTVIGFLESIRRGNPTDKVFQRMVIRDFIKAVYLFDDHFKIVVDFTGKENTIEKPFAVSSNLTESAVQGFAQGLVRCTKTVLGEPLNRCNSIEFTEQGFVITWYFTANP